MILTFNDISQDLCACKLQGQDVYFSCKVNLSDKDYYSDSKYPYEYRYRLLCYPIELKQNEIQTVESIKLEKQWSEWKTLSDIEIQDDVAEITVGCQETIPHFAYDVYCQLELVVRDPDHLISEPIISEGVLALYKNQRISASVKTQPIGLDNVSKATITIKDAGIIRPYNWSTVSDTLQSEYITALNKKPVRFEVSTSLTGSDDESTYILPKDWSQNLDKDDYGWDLASKNNGQWKLTYFTNLSDISTMEWNSSQIIAEKGKYGSTGDIHSLTSSPYIESKWNRSCFCDKNGNPTAALGQDGWYTNYNTRWTGKAFESNNNTNGISVFPGNRQGKILAVVFRANAPGQYSYRETLAPTNVLKGLSNITIKCSVYKNGEYLKEIIINNATSEVSLENSDFIALAKGDLLIFGFSCIPDPHGLDKGDEKPLVVIKNLTITGRLWQLSSEYAFPYNSFKPITYSYDIDTKEFSNLNSLGYSANITIGNFREFNENKPLGLSHSQILTLYRRNPPLQIYNKSVQIGVPLGDDNKDYESSKLLIDNRRPDEQTYNVELRSETDPSILFTHDQGSEKQDGTLSLVPNPIKIDTRMLMTNRPIAIGNDPSNCVIFSYDAGLRITIVNNGNSTDIPLVFGDSK